MSKSSKNCVKCLTSGGNGWRGYVTVDVPFFEGTKQLARKKEMTKTSKKKAARAADSRVVEY